MRNTPQKDYSRQRGAAMFVAVALLALAGLGVALSNGFQTVATNSQVQLAAGATAPARPVPLPPRKPALDAAVEGGRFARGQTGLQVAARTPAPRH